MKVLPRSWATSLGRGLVLTESSPLKKLGLVNNRYPKLTHRHGRINRFLRRILLSACWHRGGFDD